MVSTDVQIKASVLNPDACTLFSLSLAYQSKFGVYHLPHFSLCSKHTNLLFLKQIMFITNTRSMFTLFPFSERLTPQLFYIVNFHSFSIFQPFLKALSSPDRSETFQTQSQHHILFLRSVFLCFKCFIH